MKLDEMAARIRSLESQVADLKEELSDFRLDIGMVAAHFMEPKVVPRFPQELKAMGYKEPEDMKQRIAASRERQKAYRKMESKRRAERKNLREISRGQSPGSAQRPAT
jgi:hypothetical protein